MLERKSHEVKFVLNKRIRGWKIHLIRGSHAWEFQIGRLVLMYRDDGLLFDTNGRAIHPDNANYLCSKFYAWTDPYGTK